LFRLNPQTGIFEFFDRRDGLISDNFLLGAVHKNEEGWLFFGSENGIQVIDPEKVDATNKSKIDYFFTHLSLSQQSDSLKNRTIDLSDQNRIELSYKEQSFTIHFTTLNYFQAQKTQYEYQLEGLHDTWQSNGNKRSVALVGLSPKKYKLKVKAVNPNLYFEQEYIEISIHILPPWWQRTWAYVLYTLFTIAAIYGLYRFQLRQKLKEAEAARLQELDGLKTRFYTNITHELRTPLTIVLGISEQLKAFSKKEIQQKGQIIERNGQQLLSLINQILDLSKLEAGKLPVQLEHGDLLVYLRYLLESFHSLAVQKDIRLHFLPEVEALWMDYDAEKIKQILSNLLSNALKYTPSGGDIYLQITKEQDQMLLTIRDTGKGIAAEHLPYIFDRFYQTEDSSGGTGVGLALTKELVVLLGGTIKVKSNFGTQFEVRLPILKGDHVALTPIREKAIMAKDSAFEPILKTPNLGEDVPLILLVEDNQDV
ncbi:MAG: ATP-binding protein, partial [Bacteroidota bacterium]